MDEYLFIYGTLREPEVQKKIIGRIIDGTPDTLSGYKKSTIVINNLMYPILIPEQNGVITGEVLKLSNDELKKIDEYETDAYRRIKVNLTSEKEAWVYVK